MKKAFYQTVFAQEKYFRRESYFTIRLLVMDICLKMHNIKKKVLLEAWPSGLRRWLKAPVLTDLKSGFQIIIRF
jgi:hypothetical protein